MDKMNKDQFEKFIADNCSTEEPSAEVFDRLQKEAIWNNPAKPLPAGPPLLTIFVLCAILAAVFLMAPADKKQQNTIPSTPVEDLPQAQSTVDVIARADDLPEVGAYRFMVNRSDDFQLSFSADNSGITTLGGARESSDVLN